MGNVSGDSARVVEVTIDLRDGNFRRFCPSAHTGARVSPTARFQLGPISGAKYVRIFHELTAFRAASLYQSDHKKHGCHFTLSIPLLPPIASAAMLRIEESKSTLSRFLRNRVAGLIGRPSLPVLQSNPNRPCSNTPFRRGLALHPLVSDQRGDTRTSRFSLSGKPNPKHAVTNVHVLRALGNPDASVDCEEFAPVVRPPLRKCHRFHRPPRLVELSIDMQIGVLLGQPSGTQTTVDTGVFDPAGKVKRLSFLISASKAFLSRGSRSSCGSNDVPRSAPTSVAEKAGLEARDKAQIKVITHFASPLCS